MENTGRRPDKPRRAHRFFVNPPEAGIYRLIFHTADYVQEIQYHLFCFPDGPPVIFSISEHEEKIPRSAFLLNPFGYSHLSWQLNRFFEIPPPYHAFLSPDFAEALLQAGEAGFRRASRTGCRAAVLKRRNHCSF